MSHKILMNGRGTTWTIAPTYWQRQPQGPDSPSVRQASGFPCLSLPVCLGFVSETIIAKELLEVCRNGLVSSVQEMLRDHLTDEARHSRYFSEVFQYLWLTLNGSQRTFAAKLLMDIILIFFEVDERWLKESLDSVGLRENCVAEILSALTGPQACLDRARSGAGATLQAMEKAGFFDLSSNQQIFTKAGLVDG